MSTKRIKGPIVVIALYRPKPRKARQLLECVKDHLPILRKQRLITSRRPIVMRASDGTILEVFEWKSEQAIGDAHGNAEVGKLWKRFDACCTYARLSDLAEAGEMFPGFEPVEV